MEEFLEQDIIGWYMPPELRWQGPQGTQWLREGARIPPIFRGWVPVVLAEAQPKQEPTPTMPSNTRYTVEVEGHARTYWDNIHDAITSGQRAVYASPDAIAHAIDDLKAGRFAEWGYGFSAVRIYPPQAEAQPAAPEVKID